MNKEAFLIMLNSNDVKIIRELAGKVREVAALPMQEEKRKLWRRLNGLKPVRPMVMIDQVCWNEMDLNGELTLRCTDKELRGYEQELRQTLFQWKYFPVDMVVEPFIRVPKAINNTGFGIAIEEEIVATDSTNSVVSHKFENQFQKDEDVEKIQIPSVTHNQEETDRRLKVAHELFDGSLEILPWGMEVSYALWDTLACWMGAENALYAITDKPEFVHKIADRIADGYIATIDQLEEQGLLCGPQSIIHCTGAYSDELPHEGYDPKKVRTEDIWTFGLAQILGFVSPAMFKEFEVDYISRFAKRFGLVYYGCCDPLDKKMSQVRMIPNVRKVSMSPWANKENGAKEIGKDYVFSCKPNPALLASGKFNVEVVKEDLLETKRACEKYGCSLEFILKDISTVRHEPQRIFEWARIAMSIV